MKVRCTCQSKYLVRIARTSSDYYTVYLGVHHVKSHTPRESELKHSEQHLLRHTLDVVDIENHGALVDERN